MPRREIDSSRLDEDFLGNNAAVTCPVCGKVYIVSAFPRSSAGERTCPNSACGKSKATVQGGAKSGGKAHIEWPG
jgi:hypothetical protein